MSSSVVTKSSIPYFFDPRSISGCQLWLDGADRSTQNASTITLWRDKSGQGKNFTATTGPTQGTYNGYSVVSFNGSSQSMIGTTTVPANAHTLIAVHRPVVINGFLQGNTSLFRFQGDGVSYIVFPYMNGSTPRGYITSYNGTPINFTNSTLVENSVTTSLNIIMAVITSGSQQVYKNGTLQSSNTQTLNSGTSSTMRLGTLDTEYYQGDLGEMIIYPYNLTTSQRQQVEGYLAWKWGLQTSLPSNHPFRTNAPVSIVNPAPALPPFAGRQALLYFDPRSISGCQLWLDAADVNGNGTSLSNGASIATWVDKSRNGRTLTTTTTGTGSVTYSTYGGIGSILFNSTNTNRAYMRVVSAVNLTNFTVFAVSRCRTQVNNQSCLLAVSSTDWQYDSTDGFGMFIDTPSTSQDRFYGSKNANVVTNANTPGIDAYPLRMMCWINTSAGVLSSWVNGNNGNTNSSGSTRTSTATGFGIGFDIQGQSGTPTTTLCVSQFSEFVVFNAALSTSQRQQIEGYLAWKWGLQSSLPSNHPFRNSLPTSYPLLILPKAIVTGRFQPTQITGLQLWLDAADSSTFVLSGSNVTQWNDKSGNAKNFTVNGTPGTYNTSRKALVLANNRYDSTYTANVTNETLFTVFMPTVNGSMYIFYPQPMVGGRGVGTYGSASMYGIVNGEVAWGATTSGLNGVNTRNMGVSVVTAKTDTQVSANGGSLTAITKVPAFSAGNTTIGIFNGSLYSWYGDIYEIVAYNTVLTTSQRQQIEGYLAWKWGLVANLPSTHPYKVFPPPS